MKTIAILLSSFISVAAYASDFSGMFSPDGKSLKFTVTDNVAAYPFAAGRIWDLLKGSDTARSITAFGLNIECEKVSGTSIQDYFGKCVFAVDRSLLRENGGFFAFVLIGKTAKAMNGNFNYDPFSTGFDAGDHDIAINVDRRNGAFSVVFKKSDIK